MAKFVPLGQIYYRNQRRLQGIMKRRNERYYTQKAQKLIAQRTREFNQTNRNLSSSAANRRTVGFGKGLIQGLSFLPAKDTPTFQERRIQQYAPKAASELFKRTNQLRNSRDAILNKSGAYKGANFVGNAAGIILGAMAGGGATKALAGKAVASKVGRNKIMLKGGKVLAKIASEEGAKKSLIRSGVRKALLRAARNAGRDVSTQAARNVAVKRTALNASKGLFKNVAQDVAYDTTFGAAKDISRYIESGKNPMKNKADFAKYMAENAGYNALFGAVGNAILPAAKALKRSGKAASGVPYRKIDYKAAKKDKVYMDWLKKHGPDDLGTTTKNFDLKNPRKSLKDVDVSDLKGRKVVGSKQTGLKADTVRMGKNGKLLYQRAVLNNAKTRADINGPKPVLSASGKKTAEVSALRRYAKQNGENVRDIIADNYNPQTKLRAYKQMLNDYDDSIKKSEEQLKRAAARSESAERVVNNRAQKSVAQNKVAATVDSINEDLERAAKKGDYSERYMPKYDTRSLNYIDDNAVDKWVRKHTDYKDTFDYARKKRMEPSEAREKIRDQIAETQGRRLLTDEESRALREQLDREAVDTGTDAASRMRTRMSVEADADDVTAPMMNGKRPLDEANAANGTATKQTTETINDYIPNERTGHVAGRSQAADTAEQAAARNDEQLKKIDDYLTQSGDDKKFTQTHKEALDNAAATIDSEGDEAVRNTLNTKMKYGERLSDNDVASGAILMEKYNNEWIDAKKALRNGTGTEEAVKAAEKKLDNVVSVMSVSQSEAGRSLAASKILAKATPQGRVNAVLMMKDKLAKAHGVGKIQVDDDLLEMLRKAKNANDIQDVQNAIAVQIWDQIPGTFGEKVAAYRYLAMLGNPRTHIRNLAGNAAFTLPRTISDNLEAALQAAMSKSKRLNGVKTTTFLNRFSKQSKILRNYARQDWDKMKAQFLNGDVKYTANSALRPEEAVQYIPAPIRKLYEINGKALNEEDEWFARPAYETAFAKYLKANNINYEDAAEDQLLKARNYAYQRALEATYREKNAFSDFINSARIHASDSLDDIKKLPKEKQALAMFQSMGGKAVDTLIPFAKTPANILHEGIVNYNPAVALPVGLWKVAKGKTADEVLKGIRKLSTGLTGLGMWGLGYYLAKQKMMTGTNGGTDQEWYDRDRGIQDYSITIDPEGAARKIGMADLLDKIAYSPDTVDKGQKVNATLDWAIPGAIPLFMGVNSYAAMNSGDDTDEDSSKVLDGLTRFLSSIPATAEPAFETSMLSSLERVFDTSKQKSSSTQDGLGLNAFSQILQNFITSRGSQYLPTLGGQIANVVAPSRRDTRSPNSGELGYWDNTRRQYANKLPGVNVLTNPAKSDAFGNVLKEKKSPADYVTSALENFLSPANIRTVRDTTVDKELSRLVRSGKVASSDILPRTAYKNDITPEFGNQKFKVTAQDIAKFNEIKGQTAHEGLQKLFQTKAYKNAAADEKTKMIKDVYEDAKEAAQKAFVKSKTNFTEYEYEYKSMSDSARDKFNEKYKAMKTAGSKMNKKTYMRIFNDAYHYDGGREDLYSGAGDVAKILRGSKIKGGIRTYDEANAAFGTSASPLSKTKWEKAVNLDKWGVSPKVAAKFSLTNEQKKRVCNSSGRIDEKKLALYINRKNISRRAKRIMFELNRYYYMDNPF